MSHKLIIFCNCQNRGETSKWIEFSDIVTHINSVELLRVTDLCGVCVLEPDTLLKSINRANNVFILACYQRTGLLLLQKIGITDLKNIQLFSILDHDTADLELALNQFVYGKNEDGNKALKNNEGMVWPKLTSDPLWPSWYPLIDNQRCNSCGQCADFLFIRSVHKKEGSVKVVNPGCCKNNCPACARICPQVAIVFPKYSPGGAIGGSDSFDEVVEMQRFQQDISEILGGDIYEALQRRKLSKRSIIREEAMKKALSERETAWNNENSNHSASG